MNWYKRILIVVTTTLVVFFVSVILFEDKASAQSLLEDSPSFGIDTQEDELDEIQSLVFDVNTTLYEKMEYVQEIKEMKAELRQSIDELSNEIEELEAKVAAKKAEEARVAEAARLAPVYVPTTSAVSTTSVPTVAVNTAGNTYSYGYCTWYVANRASWIPNLLGNANTWYYRYGGAKGSAPQAGAVGSEIGGNHVVYIESVNGDGTVTISEMNGMAGWGVVGSRVTSASEFLYLYP